MLPYSWFVIITIGGTALALLLSLLSSALRKWPWSNRIGCAFGGAALGSFASALLILGYEQLGSGMLSYVVPLSISAIFGVGMQKSVHEGRVPFVPFE